MYYSGTDLPIRLPDRALAHVKVVATTKLRRNESFTLSWQHSAEEPGGRSTIWLHPSIPLRFVFEDPQPYALDSEWLAHLANAANSSGGIALVIDELDSSDDPSAGRGPAGDASLIRS